MKSRMNNAEEGISYLEDRMMEIEQQTKSQKKKIKIKQYNRPMG